jgi:hypothetical protein
VTSPPGIHHSTPSRIRVPSFTLPRGGDAKRLPGTGALRSARLGAVFPLRRHPLEVTAERVASSTLLAAAAAAASEDGGSAETATMLLANALTLRLVHAPVMVMYVQNRCGSIIGLHTYRAWKPE